MIESYQQQSIPVMKILKLLNRSRQTIYNIINFLRQGRTALDYYTQYKENKKQCGRRRIVLPRNQKVYIKQKVA